ncbi:MAG: hypothetical protein DCC46_08505 [Armatimonadetes bacterium]|nr:MAG: hypothetical protein DCC46_08505 [Armatimonadota bacterium]
MLTPPVCTSTLLDGASIVSIRIRLQVGWQQFLTRLPAEADGHSFLISPDSTTLKEQLNSIKMRTSSSMISMSHPTMPLAQVQSYPYTF